jgi:hypothetical protein
LDWKVMAGFDDASVLDQTTPWAPTTPLAPPPTAAPAPPASAGGKITPETHPQYFSSPDVSPSAATGLAQPAATPVKPAAPAQSGEDQYMATVRRRESGGNDMARNGSTAFGRYQFTPQTWLGVAAAHPELGLRPEDIWNGDRQDQAMRALTADNARTLKESGLPDTPGNLYMMHFLGQGGGPKFLKAMQADPNGDAASMFPLEAQYNRNIFFDPSGQPRTLGQIYGRMTNDFGGASVITATKSPDEDKPAVEASEAESAQAPAEEVSIPALPAGLKPIAPAQPVGAKIPPLPAGLKAITTKELYDKDVASTNPFAAPPAQPSKESENYDYTVNPDGSIVFNDPKEQERYIAGQAGAVKGFGSGLAQDVTGIGEILPNSLGGGYAAEATKYLQSIGDPTAQTVGSLAGLAVPFGGGVKAAGTAVRGVEEAAPLLTKMYRGFEAGAPSAVVTSAASPTGKTDQAERANQKAADIAAGTAVAAVGGAGIPAASAAAKWIAKELPAIPKFVSDLFGAEAKRATQELRSGYNEATGKILTEEEANARIAAVKEDAERVKIAQHEQELGRIEKAQQAVAESERVRTEKGRGAAQTDDPEAAARIRAKVSADLRERVREAEKREIAAGATVDEARSHVEVMEHAETSARESVDRLTQEFATRPPTSPETLGQKIHDAARADMEALKAERREKSGFAAAVESDGGKPSVPTKQFLEAIKNAEPGMTSPEAQAALSRLKTNLRTETDSGRITAVSTRKALRLVKTLDSQIEGVTNTSEAHELIELKNKFIQHMEDTHPDLRTAREKYAKLSRPLDVYERTGALKKAVQVDPYSDENVVDTTKIVGAILNRTEGGADALGRLVAKNQELKEAARGYFNQQLFGIPGALKTPTAAQFGNFLRDNRLALDRAGLTREFSSLKEAREASEKAIASAKTDVTAAKQAVKGPEAARKAALEKVTSERSLWKRGVAREEETRKSSISLREAADEPAAARAKEAVKRLKEQTKGTEAEISERQKSIKDLASAQADSLANKKRFDDLDARLKVATTPKEVVAESEKTLEAINNSGRMSKDQYEKALTELKNVRKTVSDTARSRSITIKILAAAVGGELAHRFISSRLSTNVSH